MSTPLEEAKALRRAGRFPEALQLLENFMGTLNSNQHNDQVTCLNEQSQCLWRTGNLEEAEDHARKALELAESLSSDFSGQGDALSNLGVIYFQKGALEEAEEYHQCSLAVRKQIGDLHAIALSLNNLGIVYWQRGALGKAEKCLQRSLAYKEQIGHPQDIANSLNNLGEVHRQRGEFERAEDCYRKSLTLREQLGHPQDIAVSLNNLGLVFSQRGELDQAEDYFQRSLALYKEIGHPQDISEVHYQLVQTMLTKNNIAGAENHLQQLSQLANTCELPDVTVRHILANGLMKLKHLELRSALDLGFQAKNQAIQIPFFELQVDAMQLMLQALLQIYLLTREEVHKTEIEEILRKLEQLSKKEQLHVTYIEAILFQGFLRRAEFDIKGAIEHFERTEMLALERGIRPLAQKARYEIGELKDQVGNIQRLRDLSPQTYEHVQIKEMLSYLQDAQAYLRLGRD